MAQQNAAHDGSTDAEIDPELAATTLEQAADSLQVLMTRDEMRSAAREWDTRKSGTKQQMADSMLENAQEQALGLLVEEGVELGGDLTEDEAEDDEGDLYEDAEQEQEDSEDEATSPEGMVAPQDVPAEVMDEVAREYGMGAGAVKGSLAFQDTADPQPDSEADEAALEARKRAAQEDEDEDDEQDSSTQVGSLAGDLLERSPDDYGYTAKLQMTEKQTAAVEAALADPSATQAEVAEAADCTERYANSTLNRWRGSEDEVEAAEEAGADVAPCYVDVAPEDSEDDEAENEGDA